MLPALEWCDAVLCFIDLQRTVAGGLVVNEDLQYWVGFSRVPGIGPVRLRALLNHVGDVRAAWEASAATLHAVGFDRRTIETFLSLRPKLDLAAELARVTRQGVSILTWDSPDYPASLKA